MIDSKSSAPATWQEVTPILLQNIRYGEDPRAVKQSMEDVMKIAEIADSYTVLMKKLELLDLISKLESLDI